MKFIERKILSEAVEKKRHYETSKAHDVYRAIGDDVDEVHFSSKALLLELDEDSAAPRATVYQLLGLPPVAEGYSGSNPIAPLTLSSAPAGGGVWNAPGQI